MSFYTFNEYEIPDRMGGAITRWIENGVVPGDFLSAVIRNDLAGAVVKADDKNLHNLMAYVIYFYNEAPAACWGSSENVAAWALKFQEAA